MAGRPPLGEQSRPYEVLVEPRAAREYERLQAPIRERVNRSVDRLATEPRPHGSIKLAGRHDYRIRVGDWRIVYEVDDAGRRVIVVRIAHRRDVYRR